MLRSYLSQLKHRMLPRYPCVACMATRRPAINFVDTGKAVDEYFLHCRLDLLQSAVAVAEAGRPHKSWPFKMKFRITSSYLCYGPPLPCYAVGSGCRPFCWKSPPDPAHVVCSCCTDLRSTLVASLSHLPTRASQSATPSLSPPPYYRTRILDNQVVRR